ncbi:ABC transporter substrate-binding protein [Phytoactinopolyspora mesophila]|uniref:Extracellular solute-binding protein n=1 Tax=Phytoactinopolyspora mesophila TaxID=2650750 RepID=A0A7K3M7Z3_9ACTN|nr:ABC transporter substrate-binding protein [Phytoactinopolyspora mesophila]NDL59449.1 extracellular solute-binding protein [Phytoactinopolyspora mesophila]
MRHPHPRRLATRAVLLGVAASLALTACGSDDAGSDNNNDNDNDNASAETELSDDPVTLRFTWWGSDERHQRTQDVIDLFEAEYPHITVRGEFKDWNGYWDSLATTVAANDAPDIIQMDELYLASYAERGALLDLGTVDGHLDTSGFDENALATGVVEGGQYALPVGLSAYSFVVNVDLLEEYGFDLPDDDTWSWDDLKEIGGEISEASGGAVTGVQSWGFDAGGVNIWARQAGASVYDDDGNVVIPPEVLADYWTYLSDLAEEGIAPDASTTIERSTAGLDQSGTATNNSVFATWWNTQLSSLTAASGSELQLLKLPGEADATAPGAYYKPSMYWSISARTDHPNEAALFVDFLANSEEAGGVLLTDRGVPANENVRSAIAGELTDTDTAALQYIDEITVGETPRVTPNGGSGIEAILGRYTEQVLFGQITPEDAAESFIQELQSEIDAA